MSDLRRNHPRAGTSADRRRRKTGSPYPLQIDAPQKKVDYKGRAERLLRVYSEATKSPMPEGITPMLATSAGEPFNSEDWLFEIKWDGYRALAFTGAGEAQLRSRNSLSFNDKFAPVVAALKNWNLPAILDGEVVILNEEGKADFSALQQWGRTGKGQLLFYVFDLLWLQGVDLRDRTLIERRKLLKQILPEGGIIRYSDDIEQWGIDFFKSARESGLEGIIAKRKDSTYLGDRTKNWLKIKAEERHEAVICGYTKKRGTSRYFSSLLLGVPDGKGYRYTGQVGTGFTKAVQLELLQRMVPLQTDDPPFQKPASVTDPAVWLRPHLVCEVKYTELTKEGVMRHPSFQGLREDKTAPQYNSEEISAKPQLLIGEEEESKIVDVHGHALKLTNLKKVFWIKEGITKGDLLNYYDAVSPFLMPYLKGRPQSLNRHPAGIHGKSFYQKNMAGQVDSWIQTFRRVSESTLLPKYFLVCADEAHLLYMVNLGCIEINPWHSTIQKPQNPTWCVIDLDPGAISFKKVVETALLVKEVLDSLGIVSYPKTSGSTGIHIYLPLEGQYAYEQSKQLAELIVTLVHEQLPKTTSLERSPAKRPDKIYLDYLQNRPIQTICSPYSVRPKKGATVSAPLHWSEVTEKLRIEDFTLHNIMDRVRREGDLFSGVLGKGIDLPKVLELLTRQLH